MENWYEFTSYNSPAAYGYGAEDEAKAYCSILNRKRDTYTYCRLSDDDAEALDSGRDSDGFRLDLALDTQAEIDEYNART